MGGMVLQTNMSDILARIEDQNKLVKQEVRIEYGGYIFRESIKQNFRLDFQLHLLVPSVL